MKKFEIGKPTDYDKINAWFKHCTSEQIPYIIIRKRNKYSSIEWDYINFDSKIDDIFREHREEHISEVINLFKKYAVKKSSYRISSLLFTADNIPSENAKYLAEELFDLIVNRIQFSVV